MTSEDVKALLKFIKRKRPNLFDERQSAEILTAWQKALAKYDSSEVDELLQNGFYIPYYNYKPSILEDFIKALDQQRYENTSKGIAEKELLIENWYKKHPRKPKQKNRNLCLIVRTAQMSSRNSVVVGYV